MYNIAYTLFALKLSQVRNKHTSYSLRARSEDEEIAKSYDIAVRLKMIFILQQNNCNNCKMILYANRVIAH